MKVQIKQVEGLSFVGKGESNHWVAIDGPKEFFGSEAASRPMELLLIALGACTGSDVVSILKKKRVNLDSFKLNIQAERAKNHPKVFTKIYMEYIFHGSNLDINALKKTIEISQDKYCSISSMLKNNVKMSYSCQIAKNQ